MYAKPSKYKDIINICFSQGRATLTNETKMHVSFFVLLPKVTSPPKDKKHQHICSWRTESRNSGAVWTPLPFCQGPTACRALCHRNPRCAKQTCLLLPPASLAGKGSTGRPPLSPLQLSKQTRAGWECLLGRGTWSSYLVLKPPAASPALPSRWFSCPGRPVRARGSCPPSPKGRGSPALLPRRPGDGSPSLPPHCTFLGDLGGGRGPPRIWHPPPSRRSFPRLGRRSAQSPGIRARAWRQRTGPRAPGLGAALRPPLLALQVQGHGFVPAPPPTRATFLRFPPAAGFGGSMLPAPRRGCRRLQRAAEPGAPRRSPRPGLGG